MHALHRGVIQGRSALVIGTVGLNKSSFVLPPREQVLSNEPQGRSHVNQLLL